MIYCCGNCTLWDCEIPGEGLCVNKKSDYYMCTNPPEFKCNKFSGQDYTWCETRKRKVKWKYIWPALVGVFVGFVMSIIFVYLLELVKGE